MATVADLRLYIPLMDEEPNTFPLEGINDVKTVEMNGWTNNIPINFPGLKIDLNVKVVDVPNKEIPKNYHEDMLTYAKDLKYYEFRAKSFYQTIDYPIILTVIAKKGLQSVLKNGKLLIFGVLVVGDDTGYCILNVMNNAVQTLHEQVKFGDRLLINRCKAKTKYATLYKACFNEGLQLNLELKVTEYECRQVFILKDPNGPTLIRIPDIFTTEKELCPPSKILAASQEYASQSEIQPHFLDIIGVVSFVGRLERAKTYEWKIEVRDTPKKEYKRYQTYTAFRWLELVDSTNNKPIPLLLFVNNTVWNEQNKLVPGSLVILSNVFWQTRSFSYPGLKSSVFTQVYVNGDMANYLGRLPPPLKTPAREAFGSGKMQSILTREDVCWSVGGLYSQPFMSDSMFRDLVLSEVGPGNKPLIRSPPQEPPIVKREALRVYFRGKIIAYRMLDKVGTKKLCKSASGLEGFLDYKKYACRNPLSPNGNWYAFAKELPKLDLIKAAKVLNERKISINQYARESYQNYCDPLLMPPASEDMSLKDLPMVCGPPYYWVSIGDLQEEHAYTCIWRPSQHLDIQEMTKKLEDNKDGWILGMIDIYCVDDKAKSENSRYEVVLQDFTVDPEPPKIPRRLEKLMAEAAAKGEGQETEEAGTYQNPPVSTPSKRQKLI